MASLFKVRIRRRRKRDEMRNVSQRAVMLTQSCHRKKKKTLLSVNRCAFNSKLAVCAIKKALRGKSSVKGAG